MADTVDTLITRYQLDAGQYEAQTKKATQATKGFTAAVDDAHKAVKGGGSSKSQGLIEGAADSIGSGMSGFKDVMGVVSDLGVIWDTVVLPVKLFVRAVTLAAEAMAAAGAAFIGFASMAMKASAEIDSLKRGLNAITGSAAETEKQFLRLRDVAKLPGLGFSEAIEGSINLQAAGFSAALAERALRGFGNALATVGKGKDDLFGVITALSQIASKGVVSAEEIMQIAERVPQIRKIMQAAFGTANTESIQKMGLSVEAFISGIVTELEKLPKATGGFQNSFENFGDAIKIGLASAGDALNKLFLPAIDKAAEFIQTLSDSGVFASLANQVGTIFGGGDENLFVSMIAYAVAALEQVVPVVRAVQLSLKFMFDGIIDTLNEIFEKISSIPFMPDLGAIDAMKSDWNFLGSAFQKIGDTVQSRHDELVAMASNKKDQPLTDADKSAKNNFGTDLSQIAGNTKKIAENTKRALDLKSLSLGGRELARLGVTARESGFVPHGTHEDDLMRAVRLIGQWAVRKNYEAQIDQARTGLRG